MQPLLVHDGDDLPTIYFRIIDQDNNVWVDVSASTTVVTAKFREKNTTTVLQTVTCTKTAWASNGLVSMTWPATALDLDAGNYEIEVSVSFNGDIQTANRYFWEGTSYDDDDTMPVKVKGEF